jgi:hypothetical protein
MMKRIVTLGLILGLLVLASPAQARYGTGLVDTWLSRHGVTVGQDANPGKMTVRLLNPSSSKQVNWGITASGGSLGTYHLTFLGCASGGGVGFRYFLPNGREVTWKVVHDGYTRDVHELGVSRTLIVRVTSRAKGAERTCTLRAQGNTGHDSVNLHVITN